MPVTINAKSEAPIGANYLYNMIYGAVYYTTIINNQVCELPGCTWGTDNTIYNWCIYLGALAPVAVSSDYTSNIPPSTTAVSGTGYNYGLVNDYNYMGPIVCSDQTLTCSVIRTQSQSFS